MSKEDLYFTQLLRDSYQTDLEEIDEDMDNTIEDLDDEVLNSILLNI